MKKLNCACAYNHTVERNLILLFLRTALAPYSYTYAHRSHIIVYYVPGRTIWVITRSATMLAGDRSRDKAETKLRRDQSCEHFKQVS